MDVNLYGVLGIYLKKFICFILVIEKVHLFIIKSWIDVHYLPLAEALKCIHEVIFNVCPPLLGT